MTRRETIPAWLARGFSFIASVVLLAACGDPIAIFECKPEDGIAVYCGIEKPEDIAPLGDSNWLLVSSMRAFRDPAVSGAIFALNTENGDIREIERDDTPLTGTLSCGAPPAIFKPRGFDVIQTGEDSFKLYVVNAAEGQRIERYAVSTETGVPGLTWDGCVSIPDEYLINDVAAFADGSLAASHMYTQPRSRLMDAKLFLGLNTGFAVHWTAQNGWVKLDGSDASIANGIAVDDQTGTIYVASTYGETVTAISRQGGPVRRADIPVQPDNITWSDDGRLLTVGHNGIPLLGTSACREITPTPCSFEFEVIALDPETLSVSTLYRHGQGLIPGASTALLHNGDLYFGTAMGDRVSRVSLPRP